MKKILCVVILIMTSITVFSRATYKVIVAAYSSEKAAKRECSIYQKRGFKAKVLVSPDGKVYRVSVAEYKEYDDATIAIDKLTKAGKIPFDAWATNNAKLTGQPIATSSSLEMKLRSIERAIDKKYGGKSGSTYEIINLDERLVNLESSIQLIANRVSRLNSRFDIIKSNHNNVILGDGVMGSQKYHELKSIKAEILELKSLLLSTKEMVQPKVEEPKKVVLPPKVEKPKPKPKSVVKAPRKRTSWKDFDVNNKQVVAAVGNAYNLIYQAYNENLEPKQSYLQFHINDSKTNLDGADYQEALLYFSRYAKFDGALLAGLEQGFKISGQAVKNGVNYGVSRGFIAGYIQGRIDKIVKGQRIANMKLFLDKLDVRVHTPSQLPRMKIKDQKIFEKTFKERYKDIYPSGYSTGFSTPL